MVGKNYRRSEVIGAAALVILVGLGFIVYGFYTVQTERQQRSRIEEITTTAPVRELVAVCNSKDEHAVDWEGTLLVSLLESRWYESEEEAARAEELGIECEPHIPAGAFLVCELELENVDATFTNNRGVDITMFDESQFNLQLPSGERVGAVTLYTVQSMDETRPYTCFELTPGTCTVIKLGFMLPQDEDSNDLTLLLGRGLFRFPIAGSLVEA